MRWRVWFFFPATAVRAQGPAFPGEGGVVSVVGGTGAGGRTKPTVTIDSNDDFPTNEIFEVEITFTVSVTGFDTEDIDVDNGNKVSDVTGSGRTYRIRIRPSSGVDDDVTVTVRANAAENDGDYNDEEIATFEVDTRGPRPESGGTVDREEVILTFDEELDRNSGDPDDFTVEVGNRDYTVRTLDFKHDQVILTLHDPVGAGDRVRVSYAPGTDSIQDILGNGAASFPSQSIDNITDDDDLPGAPRNLIAEATGRTEIDLEWDAPRDEGASDITAYELEVSDDGRSGWDIVDDDIDDDDREYTDDRLEPGTRYFYRIRAINDDGEGEWSDVANAITEGGRPGAPTDLRRPRTGATKSTCRGGLRRMTAETTSPAIGSRCRRTETAGMTSKMTRAPPAPPTPTRGSIPATHGTTGSRRSTRPARASPPTRPAPLRRSAFPASR